MTGLSKYNEAISYIDNQFAFFVTHVLNIGRPMDTYEIPTACVMTEEKKAKSERVGDNFYFAFNPNFAKELEIEDYAFVLAHETMHILLDHLNLAPKFTDKVRFNIAADCVINDYLIDAGFEPSEKLSEELMSGIKNVGYNCAHATVGQVYDDIPQDIVDQMGAGMALDDHTWIHVPESMMKDIIEKITNSVESNVGIPQDIKDIKLDKNTTTVFGAGKGHYDAAAFVEAHGVSMNWINLLKELDPNLFEMRGGKKPSASYHRRPRKLSGFPDTILPVKKPGHKKSFGEKPVIFMALDTSGSIGEATARKFVTLARSIPKDEIHLEVVTFTDTVRPLDLENPRYSSGGTAFSPIESYIQRVVKPKYKNKYPKSVVVITDGDAYFSNVSPDSKHKDNWLWLLEGRYCRSGHLFGKIKYLKDFIN